MALISELTEVSAFDRELLEDDEFLETLARTLDIPVASDAVADQIAANLTGPVLEHVDERLEQLGTVQGQTNEFALQGAVTDEIELGGLCAEFNDDDGTADEGPVTPLSGELRESGDVGE